MEEKKKYDYNYDFLREYMAKNGILNTDLLEVLGNRNYAMLKAWREQQRPMSVESMLKICNHYDISVSNFFIIRQSEYSVDDDFESESEVLRAQIKYQKSLAEIMAKHKEEIAELNQRYLSIIERLSITLRESLVIREEKGYTVKRSQPKMVAESLPPKKR